MNSRTKATFACLAVALGATAMSGATPAAAGNERMELHCDSGSLAGHVLQRTNGSSWWDVQSGAVYTTKSIAISDGDAVVHQHEYGNKSQAPETCTGTHFEWTWDVEVVRARA